MCGQGWDDIPSLCLPAPSACPCAPVTLHTPQQHPLTPNIPWEILFSRRHWHPNTRYWYYYYYSFSKFFLQSFVPVGSDETDIYSNPVEQKIKKSASLERKKKMSIPLDLQGAINLDHHHQMGVELSDYASVDDAVRHTQMTAVMVNSLRGQSRRSPSMSPPPPPPPTSSPPHSHHTPIPEEDGGKGVEPADMYATVETAQNRPLSPEGAKRGYDHLQPDDSPPLKGYDHLPAPIRPAPVRPPRTDLIPKSNGVLSRKYAPLGIATPTNHEGGRATPPSNVYDEREGPMYATIDVVKPRKQLAPAPKPPIRTVPDRTPSPTPMPLPRTVPTAVSIEDAMYSAVSKPKVKRASHQRIKSADYTLSHDPVPQQQGVEQMYSVVQKPRPQPKPRRSATPDEPMYSVPEKKRKPPVAPKPTSRSPTPNSMETGGIGEKATSLRVPTHRTEKFTHMRSESFDTCLLTSCHSSPYSTSSSSSPPSAVRSDLRSARSQSMNQPSPLAGQRSPSPDVSPSRSIDRPLYSHAHSYTHTYTHMHTHTQIKTFSSLPNSYRNRARIRESDMQRARSKEELTTRTHNYAQGSPHAHYEPQGGASRSPRVSRDHGGSPHMGNSPRGSFDQGGSPQLVWALRARVEDEDYRDDQRSGFI